MSSGLQVYGEVGPAVAADGTTPAIRQDNSGAVVVSEVHGRYYEGTFRKTRFRGGNLAPVGTTAGFATTYTGLVLVNPLQSPVNLVVDKLTWAALVAQTASLILGVMQGYAQTNVTITTPVAVGNANGGGPAGYGILASSATLSVAPTSILPLDSLITGALTTSTDGGKFVDLEGSLIIPPGGFAAFWTQVASVAASLAFGVSWEEVKISG